MPIHRTINIRGQFGVQVLQAAVGLSTLPKDYHPVIVVNNGGNVIPQPALKIEAESEAPIRLLPHVTARVDSDGFDKTPYWTVGAGARIFSREGLDNIRKHMASNPTIVHSRASIGPYVAVHIRGFDKKMAGVHTYVKWIDSIHKRHSDIPIFLIGDDRQYIESIYDLLSDQRDVMPLHAFSWETDYAHIFNAHYVYSAPSAFVLSMLLIDPGKHIYILDRKLCDGPFANMNDYIFIDDCMTNAEGRLCRNLGYSVI